MLFPDFGVHFIAVNDGVDRTRGENEFTAIRLYLIHIFSRMENYVSSMSNIRRMEDTQPEYKCIDLQPLVSSLYDLSLIHILRKKLSALVEL